jgi:hypothetical protein
MYEKLFLNSLKNNFLNMHPRKFLSAWKFIAMRIEIHRVRFLIVIIIIQAVDPEENVSALRST